MKDLSLLIWMTQLGISVAVPLLGFVFLAIWLRNTYELGNWILFAGIFLGIFCAIKAFVQQMKILSKMYTKKGKEKTAVYFNDHN